MNIVRGHNLYNFTENDAMFAKCSMSQHYIFKNFKPSHSPITKEHNGVVASIPPTMHG